MSEDKCKFIFTKWPTGEWTIALNDEYSEELMTEMLGLGTLEESE